MAKELPFFKFEPSEWMFGRIQKQPLDVQANFITLCCKYWHKLGEYIYQDACLDFSGEFIDRLVEFKLIGVDVGPDGSFLFIKFLDKQLDECSEASKKQSIKGLKSAAARAARKQLLLTTVEQRLKVVQPNPTEEKRREDILLMVSDVSKYLSLIYKKKYDRHDGGQIGQDVDYMSEKLLQSMDVKTIKEQARNHKLYTQSQGLTLPTRLEKIQAALLDTDWISKLNDSQNKDALQNGLNNEHARRATRISNGADLPPANLGNLDN